MTKRQKELIKSFIKQKTSKNPVWGFSDVLLCIQQLRGSIILYAFIFGGYFSQVREQKAHGATWKALPNAGMNEICQIQSYKRRT